MKTAFLFPGQGAQAVGMGADLVQRWPLANTLFQKAEAVTGYNLLELCQNGPKEKLDSTVYSQPAIFTVSAALLEIVKKERPDLSADMTAGLSMGEYSALYAAGAMGFEEALRLVQQRGQAMQKAADGSEGSMVSILGLDEQKVRELCQAAADGQILEPVNFNCPGQIVISGHIQACSRSVGLAESFGAVKAIPLSVAGAFHTSMMTPAADALEKALQDCPIQSTSSVQVIANINTEFYSDPDEIRQGLVRQLVQPILWQACMEKLLAKGVEQFYEIGPGRVLTGLMKRIHRRANIVNVSTVDALDKLLNG